MTTTAKKKKPAPKKSAARAETDVRTTKADAEIEPAIGRPLLAPGTAGPDVYDLGRRLAKVGHETSISAGENPFNVYDESVQRAVQAFQRDEKIDEGFEGQLADQQLVGARTWAALISATS